MIAGYEGKRCCVMNFTKLFFIIFCISWVQGKAQDTTVHYKPDSIAISKQDTGIKVVKPHLGQTQKQDTVIVKKSEYKKKRDAVRIGYEVIGKDTIPVFLFNDVYIQSLKSEEEIKRYKKLVRDVKVALPYAKLAAFRLQMMEDNLSQITKRRERKKYIKQCEKAIKEEFMNDLKNLTITQGKLLLKLIHRETGQTTFEILSTYQGTLAPLFWSSMARLYGATTKDTFDPIMDREIEEIIQKLELE